MAATFTLTLDTTAPGGVSVSIDGGAAYASQRDVTLTIGTSDGTTAGYQMKIYGDVDDAFAPAVYRASEANAPWITYNTSQAVRLSLAEGAKTVRIKVRDDVLNESTEATDSITLDTTAPVPNVTSGPSPTKISKIATVRTSSFTWQADSAISEYKVKVVPATNSLENAGTTIPTTNGSTNMTGGAVAAETPVNSQIDGRDLELASAGDGDKIIKVFVRETGSGNWSTAS